jgi:inorganic pyrophosphatase
LEGDLLDALVLGPRLRYGTTIKTKAWGAITLCDRGMIDDKLVCSEAPLDPAQQRSVVRFFTLYAACKGFLNLLRKRPGRNACDGWLDVGSALARAVPRDASWQGPTIPF